MFPLNKGEEKSVMFGVLLICCYVFERVSTAWGTTGQHLEGTEIAIMCTATSTRSRKLDMTELSHCCLLYTSLV